MQSFDFNKIFASILIALLCMQIFDLLSNYLVKPTYLPHNILGIDGGAPITTQNTTEKSLEPITPLLATANIDKGKTIAKKCLQCHGFEKGGTNHTGPNLWGVVMNKIAHSPAYAYSASMKNHGGKWDYESLNAFLHKPREFIKGTKMSFVGLANAQDRADIIAYLRTLSNNPIPIK